MNVEEPTLKNLRFVLDDKDLPLAKRNALTRLYDINNSELQKVKIEEEAPKIARKKAEKQREIDEAVQRYVTQS